MQGEDRQVRRDCRGKEVKQLSLCWRCWNVVEQSAAAAKVSGGWVDCTQGKVRSTALWASARWRAGLKFLPRAGEGISPGAEIPSWSPASKSSRGGSVQRPCTLHPTPFTLHPTPYTLHHTPYTLHPAPYTLHPTPCTLHPTPYTLHPTSYTLHPKPYALHPARYTLHPTSYTLHHAPYTLHHTPYTLIQEIRPLNPQPGKPELEPGLQHRDNLY